MFHLDKLGHLEFHLGLREFISPLEELPAQEKFPQLSRFYPSQSARTLLKHFSELNPPTVLVPGHTTTSLSTDQMIQFARAVSLEVSLASYGLLEHLLSRARSTSNLGVRGLPDCWASPGEVSCVLGYSVASQPRYALSTRSGFTATVASVGTGRSGEMEQSTVVQGVKRYVLRMLSRSSQMNMMCHWLRYPDVWVRSRKKRSIVQVVTGVTSKFNS